MLSDEHFLFLFRLELSGSLMAALHTLQKALSEPNAFSHQNAVCSSVVFSCLKGIDSIVHNFKVKYVIILLRKLVGICIGPYGYCNAEKTRIQSNKMNLQYNL